MISSLSLIPIIPVLNINHALAVSITKVGFVRRTIVNHGFINRISGLIRENASGQTRHDLLDLISQTQFSFSYLLSPLFLVLSYIVLLGCLENIVVDKHVFTQKVELVLHVLEETTNHGSKMDNVSRLVLFKDSFGIFSLSI